MWNLNRLASGLLPLALAIGGQLRAQITVQGRVTDEAQNPVAGAQVTVEGTAFGAITSDDGAYRFVITTPRTSSVLVARRIGYRPMRATITATSGAVTQNFSLTRDVLQLSELVVTGTRVATERSQLGATLATVDASQIAAATTPQIDIALGGKIPGALVTQNSGTPGGGTSVRIRGLSTISRSAEPLYIVDGVIVDNGSRELVDLGGYTTNRLADLDPSDIDRVEVVKGAAAAALYGSRANDGVVQIFTKRGRAGALRTTFRQMVGTSSVEHTLPVNQAPTNLAGQPVTRYDYQKDIFRHAPEYNTSIAFSGGDERTQFFISGANEDQNGIIRANEYHRQNARLNLDRMLNSWLKLSASTSYIQSRADLTPEGGIVAQYGVLTNFLFLTNDRSLYRDPVTGLFPVGQFAANPLEVIANWKAPQTINRYVSGLQLQATPFADLRVDYRFGYDAFSESAQQFIPRNSSASAFVTGLASSVTDRARLINSDVDISYSSRPRSWLSLTPSVGMNWQQQKYDITTARAQDLALFTEVVQGSQQFASETQDDRRTLGFYGQAQAGMWQRLFLTAALRSDASSAFGSQERTQYFPKFGASLDVGSFDWWKNNASFVSQLRLRSAYGFSGGQPAGSFDRLSNYVFEPAGTASGVANSTRQGNDNLKPERQREIELGADAEILKGRLGFEATYYNKRVSDLILPRTVRPSTGSLDELANVGELENKGLELLVRSVNFTNKGFTWSTSATLTTSDPKVTKLSDGGPFFIPGSFNIVRVATDTGKNGSAPGHFFGTTYVRNAQGQIVDAAGNPIQNASGNIVGIPAIGPRLVIGNPNPKAFWSVSNEVTTLGRLSFRVQVDGVSGFDVFNFDRRVLETPAFGSSADYAKEIMGQVPRGYFQARRSIFEEYIEKGDFVKLRELSVSYAFAPSILSRLRASSATLTLAGRNLKTWTDFTGWDPETNASAQSTLVRGFSFATVPIPRSMSAAITLNF